MLNRLSLNKLSLNRIDLNRIGGRDVGVSTRPYIDPELLKHVKMAISTWGKTNDDPDRAILKDLTPNGNDMRLLNFGFAGNSGYGLYSTDFTKWTKRQINDLEVSPNKISVSNKDSETALVIWLDVNKNRYVIPSYKIKVSKLTKTITYYYIDEANPSIRSTFSINKEGTYILPISRNDLYNGEENTNIGFGIFPHESFTIEQLPDFEGWLCTDGVDDMIVSVKPVSEMLEGSNEITVVSIIHQISQIPRSEVNKGLNNQISYYDSPTTRGYLRNNVKDVGKTGIYGYTFNGTAHSVINNILGDKNDYIAVRNNEGIALNGVFSVCGYKNYFGELKELSSIAYAGGFIANKVLTTDEINQIIAYYNLDRPGQIIKPQLYCNIKKQGITNDNHAEFNDQLIDFVGGRNIQLNNVAWKGESGIGKYNVDFDSWIPQFNIADSVHTSNKLCVTRIKAPQAILYTRVKVNSMKVEVKGSQSLELFYQYVDKDDNMILLSLQGDGIYDLPASIASANNYYTGFRVSNYTGECDITITQIPENPDALHLDGISDFGKATGLPILKDYTVVADRKILGNNEGGTLSKSYSAGNGAFIFETGSVIYSFGTGTSGSGVQSKRMLSYLSKYIYNGNPVQAGAGIDSDSMWLGTLRDNDTRFAKLALRSLLLFSYTLSEFLLERQLKKYNAGTLYPGMVEWRPIVKSNIPYSSISYSVNPGEYIAEGSTVTITITLSNASDKLVGVSSNAISDISISGDNGVYEVTGKVTKSPQKISIVISSYLTMLGNDTLILNETLIKNE